MPHTARWAFALALLPLAACNNNPAMPLASTVPSPQTLPSVSAQDQKFVNQAVTGNLFELKSSQLALQRSRNPRTRAFAQQMISDHQANNDRLTQLAAANGISVPTGLGPEQDRAMAAIQNTTRIFDSEYFRQQALAHQATIDTYQSEADAGYNTDLKQFAQQALPQLQEHLQEAQAGRDMPMGRVSARPAYVR